MLRIVRSWLAVCLLLGTSYLVGATPLAAADPNRPRPEVQPSRSELSASDLVHTAEPTTGVGDDEIGELPPTEGAQLGTTGTGLGPAEHHPFVMNGPSEGALWMYALSGCAAVGLVAFRTGEPKE